MATTFDKTSLLAVRDAIFEGRLALLQAAHAEGFDLNAALPDGDTPLLVAVAGDRAAIVKWLLEQGADPDLTLREDGRGPLHHACAGGTAAVVEALLVGGASPSALDARGHQPIHLLLALSPERLLPPKLKLLLKHGADLNASGAGESPLRIAYRRKLLDIMKLLVKNGANVDERDTYGRTFLEQAVLAGQVEAAGVFAGKSHFLNQSDKQGYSLLMRAAQDGREAMVELLLAAGIDREACNSVGYTALHLAVQKGQAAICRRLLEAGANWRAEERTDRLNAVQWALRFAKPEVVQSFVELLSPAAIQELRQWAAGQIDDPQKWALLGGEPAPAAPTHPVPAHCPCNEFPRARIVGELSAEPCLEILPRSQYLSTPRWGHCLCRCRVTGLILEAAGIDYQGREMWELRIAHEGWPRFRALRQSGELQAAEEFVQAEAKRLGLS
ncbi:ankyrin repeat domain-containing protein [Pseudomarimonas arenosa]|uniref:Ankyrin repeat domain-containing protein n=1 Tax=Pseudomarimonas arenosa TaxID=2774145 RepID=A0AAW3ZHF4_9GAMM|nr:ankyrin repeat domain-containing protein [Pseudomarimonas arenosa]MBD8525233.1 ankyrin repeat domain-containing protein [Pseudomarimonas arenosa]